MFRKDQYQLLDFGNGRRLERFGQFVLSRPCPVAEGVSPSEPLLWQKADADYVRREPEGGNWRSKKAMPLSWPIQYGKLTFELKLTDFGHVGIFPEQAVNWDWINRQIKSAGEPLRILNLFAYTGGATMAAAAAGAEVVHVDSAQNTVLWARRNTEASGLGDASIRWITEDATKFVTRELKRKNTYHGVILDPPTYGHGPKGEVWKIQEHLKPLLEMCAELMAEHGRFVLLSCHTTKLLPAELEGMLSGTFAESKGRKIESGGLALTTSDGRQLAGGIASRWFAR
ncbi:MAG: class I SAM-dependent methyltransferase [Planctomycetia bacterium]|nr:class I SAM-dependent methyltransferase [Planctomycetia bacterium]